MGGELTFDGWPRRVALSPAHRYAIGVGLLSLPFAWASLHWYAAASAAALACAVVLAIPLYAPARITVSGDGLVFTRLGRQIRIGRGDIRAVSARPGAIEIALGSGGALYVYLPPRVDWSVGREPPEQALSRSVERAIGLGAP